MKKRAKNPKLVEFGKRNGKSARAKGGAWEREAAKLLSLATGDRWERTQRGSKQRVGDLCVQGEQGEILSAGTYVEVKFRHRFTMGLVEQWCKALPDDGRHRVLMVKGAGVPWIIFTDVMGWKWQDCLVIDFSRR